MLYELPRYEYFEARTPGEAVKALQDGGGRAAVIAGATDLLGLMKDSVSGPEMTVPERLVGVTRVPEMNGIREDADGVRIGAAVTLSRIMANESLRRGFPLLCSAAAQVGSAQLRNMGTLGGNLCQRPRCMYFRHRDFLCFKKGGKKCFAVAGENRDYHAVLRLGRCVMAHPSDTAPALTALRAVCRVSGPDGDTEIPIDEFFLGPDASGETVLGKGRILREIFIPHAGAESRQIFLKRSARHSTDFALSSVAAAAEMSGPVCGHITLVLGGVAPLPVVVPGAEEILAGKRLEKKLIEKAADEALNNAKSLSMNRYKIDMTKALIRRALTMISER